MSKAKNNYFSRIIALVLTLVMIIGTVPTDNLTAFAVSDKSLGTLSAITDGAVVSDENGTEAVISYEDAVSIEWAEADPSIGRTVDGWWVGIKMTAPVDMTKEEDFTDVTYQSMSGGQWSSAKNFWNAQDSDKENPDTERYLTMWGVINEEYLNNAIVNGSTLNYKWQFDWNADGTYEQLATLSIDPAKVVLSKAGSTVYPVSDKANVEAISEGLEIVSNKSNIVTINQSSVTTLAWAAKDDSIGRYSDGWWTGVKITAPEGTVITEESDVKYQSFGADGVWSAEKSFYNNQDSAKGADSHYMGLWTLLNETRLSSGSAISTKWRFDWDKDGVYEQLVVINIDPEKVILNDADGVQIYPELGKVETISGGTVTGATTGDAKVVVSDLSLDWTAKDLSVGRYSDGWWAGIQITAPEGTVITADGDVNYQSHTGNNVWSDVKSFYNNQDSAKEASEHYMTMWTMLDRTKLAEAQAAGEDIVAQWRFDWNKDGEYEQLVTFTIDADTVTLNRMEQTGFTFFDVEPSDKWIGDGSYTNEASGGEGNGAITYAIDESASTSGAAEIDATSGKLTLKSVGTVKVIATKAEDDVYAEATDSYTINIVKKQQTGFSISKPAPITYGDNDNTFSNVATGGEGTGEIVYELKSGDAATVNEKTGDVTILKSGTVEIIAKKLEDANYYEVIDEYTLVINKAEQSDFAFAEDAPENIVFSTEPIDMISVIGGASTGEISYEIDAEDGCAELTDDNKIQTNKAGSFILKVTKAGDDCYEEATIEREISISSAPQTGFTFTNVSPADVTYNDNGNKYTNLATGGESTGDITYAVIDGDAAVIDEKSGELTINKAGTVTIKATKAADDKYAETSAEYKLTVLPDEQAFTFADGENVKLVYGTKEYFNVVNSTVVETAADGKGYGEGSLSYEISKNDIGATIDNTGKILFKDSTDKIGTATVTVTKAADDCYKSCTASYTIEVVYQEAPEPAYILSGETKNESGWYTGNITISAPEGYQISTNNKLSTDDWADSIEYSTEGIGEKEFYLKDVNGYMTDTITAEELKIDTENPSGLAIEYEEASVKPNVNGQDYNVYKESLEVTITAKDLVSGIDYLTYNTGDSDIKIAADKLQMNEDGSVSFSFIISPEYRNKVSMAAVDVAGRKTVLEDNEIIVIDSEKPELSIGYVYTDDQYEERDGILYTQGDTKLVLSVFDSNTDLSEAEPVVKIDGVDAEITWNYSADSKEWKAEYNVSGYGDYLISVDYTDIAGNAMDTYVKELHIDSYVPVISPITYDNNDAVADSSYDANRTATIKIEEHNFAAEDVVLTVSAKDINGNTIDISTKEYDAYIKNADNWISEGDVHTAVLPVFDIDGIYSLDIEYTDKAGNKAADYAEESFILDKTAPENVTIKYEELIVEKILNAITFGFYKSTITVTVTAEDSVSGVDFFSLYYNKEEGSSEINTESFAIPKLVAVQDSKDKSLFTTTYVMPGNSKGNFEAEATDKVGNVSGKLVDKNIKVTDTIDPKVSVSYAAEDKYAEVIFVDAQGNEVKSFKDAAKAYYGGNVVATIKVNEANFLEGQSTDAGEVIHGLGIKVTKTVENTDPVITEYLPAGAVQKYEGATTAPIQWTSNGDIHTATIVFEGGGDYILELEYADLSGNAASVTNDDETVGESKYCSKDITVINAPAQILPIEYDNNAALNDNNYKASRTATVKIKDYNFNAKGAKLIVTAKDINGNPVDISGKGYEDYLSKPENWTRDGSIYMAELPVFDIDAVYTVDVEYTDIVGNAADDYKEETFVIDKIGPEDIKITYSTPVVEKIFNALTFGFYEESVEVNIEAKDKTSGIEYFVLDFEKESGSSDVNSASRTVSKLQAKVDANDESVFTANYTIPANLRGTIKVTAFDNAGNEKGKTDSDIKIVDIINPTMNVSYEAVSDTAVVSFLDKDNNSVDSFEKAVTAHYNGDVVAEISINEANFFEGKATDSGEVIHNVGIKVTKTDTDGNVTVTEYLPEGSVQKYEGAATAPIKWTSNGDVHTVAIKYENDGHYVLALEYTDLSGNASDVTDDNGTLTEDGNSYTSKVITVDEATPVIMPIEYDNNEALNGNNYKNARTATVKIQDHNFNASGVELTVKAVDINGKAVDISAKNYEEYLKNSENWKSEGNVNTAILPAFDIDAIYTVDIAYTGLVGNAADDYKEETFVIDQTAADNITISYSTPILDKVLNAVTFGFYKESVDVNITAEDATSGVEYFVLTYTKEAGSSSVNDVKANTKTIIAKQDADNKNVFTANCTMYADLRGNFSVEAFDEAGNSNIENDAKNIIVVDELDPKVSVAYEAKEEGTEVRFVDGGLSDINDFASATNAYYNGNVVSTITIDEANFFEGQKTDAGEVIHEVGIKVTKTDDAGNATVTEYLPEGSVQKYEGTATAPITWTSNGDIHTATIEFAEDGDYVVELEYVDFSGNASDVTNDNGEKFEAQKSYKSKIITVDKTAPVINAIVYDNNEAQYDNIYKANRTATVTIEEHNFRADEVKLSVSATDINGNAIDLSSKGYDSYLMNRSNWETEGNVHTATLPVFDIDGIYTADIEYTDLANNESADYAAEEMVIDHEAPTEVKIEYSSSLIDKILNALTFGFYNENVEVKLTAEDITAGVDYFVLTYTKEAGSSDVNKEGFTTENLVATQNTENKNVFTASYTMPANARGTFSVDAIDKAGNTPGTDVSHDNQIKVVDTIDPKVSVAYEAKEETTEVRFVGEGLNDVNDFASATSAYYNGNVVSTITIDEANFFEGQKTEEGEVIHEVGIKVTKTDDDGTATVTEYLPEGSVQKYEGAATLPITWTSDGDIHTATIEFAEDGDYVVELEYVDFSDNASAVTNDDGTATEKSYKSKIITVDKTAPVIKAIEYDNNEALNENNYNANRIATVTIEEHNFRADEVKISVSATDINGNAIDLSSKGYDSYLMNRSNWKTEGNVHTATLPALEIDGNYKVDIEYTDLAQNESADYTAEEIVIDHDVPTDVEISYNTPIIEKILSAISFGFYQAEVEVTLKAKDITSGVDYFVLTYTKEDGSSDVNKESFTTEKLVAVQDAENKNVFTASYTIPANARGTFSVDAIDKAGNSSNAKDETAVKVVDTISPTVNVAYEAKEETTKVRFVNSELNDVNDFASATSAYYNGNVVSTITINEANFFEGQKTDAGEVIHEVGIKVTKTDDNGTVTVTEYLPEGSVQKYEGAALPITWTSNGDIHTATIEFVEDGDYVVELEYADFSTNASDATNDDGTAAEKSYKSKIITVDKTAPVINAIVYDNNEAQYDNIYKANRPATVTIEEHNFRADEVEFIVTATDINGKTVDLSSKEYDSYLRNRANWTTVGNVHTATLPEFSIDGIYTVDITYTDLAKNESADYADETFTIDKYAPTDVVISYSTAIIEKILNAISFGFYKENVVVTLTAKDITSGVDYFVLTYSKEDGSSDVNTESFTTENLVAVQDAENKNVFTTSYTIPANARGTISVDVIDKAGNISGEDDKEKAKVVVDTIDPKVSVSYEAIEEEGKETTTEVRFVDGELKDVADFASATNAYYNGDVKATITIDEANFFEGQKATVINEDGSESEEVIHEVGIKVTKTDDNGVPTVTEYLPEGAVQKYEGAETKTIQWTPGTDIHTTTIDFTEDGDYVVEIEYVDFSTNASDVTNDDGTEGLAQKSYKSKIITVDKTAPVIKPIEYNLNKDDAQYDNIYKANRIATVTIEEHNFRADEVIFDVSAKDINGKTIDLSSKKYDEYLTDRSNWSSDGNVHTATLPVFEIDGIYTVDIEYTDLAKNESSDYPDEIFTIDHKAPTNVDISYSTPIIEKIFNAVTFGFYQPKVDITLTANDITSGVDYFILTYAKEDGSSEKNAEDLTTEKLEATQVVSADGTDKTLFTASYPIPANARGTISVTATDNAGNTSGTDDKDEVKVVVDNVAPTVSVSYEAIAEEGTETTTEVRFVDAELKDVEDFKSATNAYYNGDVKATITIDEANFFEGQKTDGGEVIHEVGIKVTKTDDAGNITATEYLPEGAVQKYEGATTKPITWTSNGDVHTATIEFTDNGDYVVELEYVDFSTNASDITNDDGTEVLAQKSYKSKIITVDETAPEIKPVVYDNNNANNVNNYNANRTATVTIEDHNFRADDVKLIITATDSNGEAVDISEKAYDKYLTDRKNWTSEGDVHVAVLPVFDIDAVYTLDIEYKDLALNDANDYAEEEFVIDKNNPTKLAIEYSENVLDNPFASVGYYQKKMTVTMSAEDITSGVDYFVYSYTLANGVSSVNKGNKDVELQVAPEGSKAVASFTIPEAELTANSQFNGTVEYTVVDNATNKSRLVDTKTIVVDNIAPTATMTYNDPVSRVNDISYYDGNIEAKLVINEANFFAEDVEIVVTRDGANYPVNVNWINNSVDEHTGTFTLTEDGDYVVTVNYKDRSLNEMAEIKSNQLTLDKTIPSVKVTNIKNNSANTDEIYGFTITVTDTNVNTSTFKPVLTALVMNSDGTFTTKNIDLGALQTVTAGQSYSYVIDNLEEDAIYTLTCSVSDYSNNSYSKMLLDDGNEYESVQMSVNRNGSTYGLDENTSALVEKYYVQHVDNNIVIVEVNADPLTEYKVTLNGDNLTEGTDYTVAMTGGNGQWMKYEYTIDKSLFEAEGEYKLVVSSKDKAENDAFSDVKDATVNFVVDRTAPVVTVSGLKTDGRYQTEKQIVTIIPTDDGGALKSLIVRLVDENGKEIEVLIDLSGEELIKALEAGNGELQFEIEEGLYQNVQIICTDCAVDGEGNTNTYDETITNVSVSSNQFMIFWANKPLRYGSIIGVLVLTLGIIIFIIWKKRKEEKEK